MVANPLPPVDQKKQRTVKEEQRGGSTNADAHANANYSIRLLLVCVMKISQERLLDSQQQKRDEEDDGMDGSKERKKRRKN